MALSDKLNIANAEKEQTEKVFEARALIQPIREDVDRVAIRLQEISDSGSFNTVDPEIKTAMVAAWQVIKDTCTSFANTTVAELLDWKP